MLDSKDILYSKGNNDECYTPEYAIRPIIKHLKDWTNRKYDLYQDITV